ncbi:hypothetical protein [Lacticaseibacillus absianus]|uniref:hypothetical protein n=1 Tax=Lacticaseibacillus absianus TaxID=2729623 RepID=UPI0015C7C19C|nr:hypothetical protein [Lacticaseibacillus absianus]
MKVEQAVAVLQARGLVSNAETVRRWIRAGKLQATLCSRKAGYDIDEADLAAFVDARDWHQVKQVKAREADRYQQGVQAGQAEMRRAYEQRLKQLIIAGAAEAEFAIGRLELQRAVLADPATTRSQAILIGLNRDFFGPYASKPWSKIVVRVTGEWLTWQQGQIVIHWPELVAAGPHPDAGWVLRVIVIWAQRRFQA